jgi:hypothetical protein
LSPAKKNDLSTLDDLRSEALVWQLDAYSCSPGGEFVTQLLESERTLQFWEGEVWSTGNICSLDGPVGELQRIDYDPSISTLQLTLVLPTLQVIPSRGLSELMRKESTSTFLTLGVLMTVLIVTGRNRIKLLWAV